MEFLNPLTIVAVDSPTVPAADESLLFMSKIATGGGRGFLRRMHEDGTYSSMQAQLGRNDVMWVNGGFGQTAPTFVGCPAMTSAGTGTARTPAITNRATRMARVGYVSSATAANMAGLYISNANSMRCTIGTGTALDGGGFLFIALITPADAASIATGKMFVGMTGNTSAPVAATEPNTFTNSIGIAQVNGGTNLQLVYGGSAAQTMIDLGANFPVGLAGATQNEYELVLYAPPNANNKVAYRVERVNTGDITQGILTAGTPGTQLPASTVFLAPRAFRSNGSTALAASLDIGSIYLESNM